MTYLQGGGYDLRKGEKRRGWLQEAEGRNRKDQGNPRVWRLGGLGSVGLLSCNYQNILFWKLDLAINFRKRRRLCR